MKTSKAYFLATATVLSLFLLAGPNRAEAKGKEKKPAAAAPAAAPVDLNSASQADLEKLPQVGATAAKKIIAARPYSSVADLSRAGLSKKAIEAITPLVTVSAAPAAAPAPAARSKEKASKSAAAASSAAAPAAAPAPKEKASKAAAPAGPIDLNTASQTEIEKLPKVGAATAKKIIAGRPYSSVQDLARAGVPAKTIETIAPLVTVGMGAAAPAAAPASAPAAPARSVPPPAAGSPMAPSAAVPNATAAVPPVKGMVWVNTSTKVYHREGDPWYGRTKQGKFMNEDDAIKAGFRASKQKEKKASQ